MGNYFILDCHPPIEAEHFSLTVDDIGNDKRWEAGLLFSLKDHREGFHPPKEVILLETDDENDDDEGYIYPVLKWVPIPLMSRALVNALIAAGVDNLQTYETRLVKPQGDNPPAEDHYLAVNIVGLVEAADIGKSVIDPTSGDTMTSVDFDSLAIDETKAHGQLMFRLAENITAVLVHRKVREQIEAAGITSLTWFDPEKWAG